MFCCAHPVWHGDGRVFKIVIRAIEIVVRIEVGFIVDDVANAAGYGPIIIPEIHDCRTGQRIQIDVIGRRVGLVQHVREVRLHEKARQRIPIQ